MSWWIVIKLHPCLVGTLLRMFLKFSQHSWASCMTDLKFHKHCKLFVDNSQELFYKLWWYLHQWYVSWRASRMFVIFNWCFTIFESLKPLEGLSLTHTFITKSLLQCLPRKLAASAIVFPNLEQNWIQTFCSFKSVTNHVCYCKSPQT